MKKALFFICYLIGLLIGAMLLIFNAQALDRDPVTLRYTMMAAGVIFIIPALIQLLSSLSPKRDELGNILPRKWYAVIVAVLALLWGIYILIFPTGYANTLAITLGVSLILAGIAQAVWIVRTAESTFLRFIVPIVTLVVGVVICVFLSADSGSGKDDQLSAIISGIMLVVWGVNGFMSLRSKRVVAAADKAAKTERKAEKEERRAEKAQAKETAKEQLEAEKEAAQADTTEEEKTVEKRGEASDKETPAPVEQPESKEESPEAPKE